ncbi:hypothetical protein ACLB2K_034214 [Fragaria x ananassa]
MPSTTSVLSTYTAFAAAAMLIRTVISEVQTIVGQFIPQKFQDKIIATLAGLFGNLPNSQMTLIIDESDGLSTNEVYQASELYLSSRITSSIDQLKTSMDFESYSSSTEVVQHKSIQLSFHKQYREKVLGTYLPYVVQRSKAIVEKNKVVKLHALGHFGGEYAAGPWSSVIFEHPSTFDTLAMDPMLKKELIADLDRFVKRKEFFGRVGKAWKRGYLLYGPPGTGKSNLIAAMANYLKFDIYDLELTYLQSNSELRRLLVSTANQSIIVIEDIDCSIELKDRQDRGTNSSDSQLTLSGLLNFIDGLWSSCGDERIIVFTTNYKDKLDPALLRPGRMDMHVHMSFCTPCGFKTLAHNYLKVTTHHLFSEIEELIKDVDTTPAEIAEELMKNEDADIVLEGLVKFLKKKKEMNCSGEANVEETKENNELEE